MMKIFPELALVLGSVLILLIDLFKKDCKFRLNYINVALIFVSALLSIFFWNSINYSNWNILKNSLDSGEALSFFKILFLLGLGVLNLVMRDYLEKMKYKAEFLILMSFSTLGMMVTIAANDLIILFLGIELSAICLYALSAFLKNEKESVEAGMKYFFMGAISSAVMIYGMSFIYGVSQSTNYYDIAGHLSQAGNNLMVQMGIVMILISFAFKLALFPFQMWIPDVYEGAPTPITAWLAIASKTAGFIALTRIVSLVFHDYNESVGSVIIVVSYLSLICGNIGALLQSNIKRLLAYSSIGHAGFMAIAILNWQSADAALLFYLLAYSVSTLLTFSLILFFYKETKTYEIKDYHVVRKKFPFLSLVFVLCMFSLIGFPPFPIFWGKFLILSSAIKNGYLFLSTIALIMTAVSAFYYLRIIKSMYLDSGKDVDVICSGRNWYYESIISVVFVFFVIISISPGIFIKLMGF